MSDLKYDKYQLQGLFDTARDHLDLVNLPDVNTNGTSLDAYASQLKEWKAAIMNTGSYIDEHLNERAKPLLADIKAKIEGLKLRFNDYKNSTDELRSLGLVSGKDDEMGPNDLFNTRLDKVNDFNRQQFATTGAMLDYTDSASKYALRINNSAKTYLDGWENVDKNQASKHANAIAQGVFDWVSGGLIATTAVFRMTQAWTAVRKDWTKIPPPDPGPSNRRDWKYPDKSEFSGLVYAVNVGQIVDAAQIATNTGWHKNTLVSIDSKNLSPGEIPIDKQTIQDLMDTATKQTDNFNHVFANKDNTSYFGQLNEKVLNYSHERGQKDLEDARGAAHDYRALHRSESEVDTAFHSKLVDSAWLTPTEKAHLLQMKTDSLNIDSYKKGFYNYSVEPVDWEQSDHPEWQGRAFQEFETQGVLVDRPLANDDWKRAVDANAYIPSAVKERMKGLSWDQWNSYLDDPGALLTYEGFYNTDTDRFHFPGHPGFAPPPPDRSPDPPSIDPGSPV